MFGYIRQTTFVEEVLDAYENRNGKDNMLPNLQELIRGSRSKSHINTNDPKRGGEILFLSVTTKNRSR